MGLRPGHCYSGMGKRAYTRLAVKVHKKNYIGAAPGLKTRQFNMGNSKRDFSHILDLVVTGRVQIRDNAFESTRIAINRFLIKHIGKDSFFMKIRVYPHNILRENKQAQGAGADRISKGMSHSFGKPIGRSARVRPGQKILSVLVDKENVEITRAALKRALARIPSGISIIAHTDTKSIGTKPSKVREVVEEKKDEEKEGEKKEEEEKEVEGKEKPVKQKDENPADKKQSDEKEKKK